MNFPHLQWISLLCWATRGGRGYRDDIYCYEEEGREWRECGCLPRGLVGQCCAVLLSGELMVAGGWNLEHG